MELLLFFTLLLASSAARIFQSSIFSVPVESGGFLSGSPVEWNTSVRLNILLGQWLNFKLFGITYLVGKVKFKLFFQGPLAK